MRSIARGDYNILNVRSLCAVDGVYSLRRSPWLRPIVISSRWNGCGSNSAARSSCTL